MKTNDYQGQKHIPGLQNKVNEIYKTPNIVKTNSWIPDKIVCEYYGNEVILVAYLSRWTNCLFGGKRSIPLFWRLSKDMPVLFTAA